MRRPFQPPKRETREQVEAELDQLCAKQELRKLDRSIVGRIEQIIDERDRLMALAGEMTSTLLLDRNAQQVNPQLREIAEKTWQPQFLAAQAGRELTDEEVSVALAASGIDITAALRRVNDAIAKHRHDEEASHA